MNPIILDTDPGIDDAVAMIVLRRFCPERVKLILASYGNISLSHTVQNALTMTGLLHWDVPVVRGAEGPSGAGSSSGDGSSGAGSRVHLEDAAHIHGSDGLGGLGLSAPAGREAFAGDWQQRVYDALVEAGTVDYLTIGPLTNLFLLLSRFPEAREHIGRVVSMGGGIGKGNVTPEAEFNIHCDPGAAAFVFRELPETALVPLNVTNQIAFSLEEIRNIASGGELSQVMGRILEQNYHACVRYGEQGSTMHDAAAALYCLFPELFTVERCGIEVDVSEAHFGRTTVTGARRNVNLAVCADAERVKALIAGSVGGEFPQKA